MNGSIKMLIYRWIEAWIAMYRHYMLRRQVKQLELDLVRLKIDMEQEGSWDGIWRSAHSALRLIPEDLLDKLDEMDLLRVTLSISEANFDKWLNVLSKVVKVYCRTCEYRKLPKDQRVNNEGTHFISPDEYVIYNDSILMLLYGTQTKSLKGLVQALLRTIDPLTAQDYEELLEPADVSYLDRTTGYMQDEMMEVVRAIVECLTNLDNTVD